MKGGGHNHGQRKNPGEAKQINVKEKAVTQVVNELLQPKRAGNAQTRFLLTALDITWPEVAR